jgi:hypothetical protein
MFRRNGLCPRRRYIRITETIFDATRTVAVEQHARDVRVHARLDVAPRHRRSQVGAGRAHAPAALDGPLQLPESVLALRVVVVRRRMAGLARRGNERVVERIVVTAELHCQRTVAAAPCVGAALPALEATTWLMFATVIGSPRID